MQATQDRKLLRGHEIGPGVEGTGRRHQVRGGITAGLEQSAAFQTENHGVAAVQRRHVAGRWQSLDRGRIHSVAATTTLTTQGFLQQVQDRTPVVTDPIRRQRLHSPIRRIGRWWQQQLSPSFFCCCSRGSHTVRSSAAVHNTVLLHDVIQNVQDIQQTK